MAGYYHQVDLGGIINFAGPNLLAADERARAKHRFYSIIDHFSTERPDAAYSRPLLVRYTYEYSRSELSQDTFLRAFFQCMSLDITAEQDPDDLNQLRDDLFSFADFLLDSFFIPRTSVNGGSPHSTPLPG